VVSRAYLGNNAALVAASALLVDYVLTVAVSVAAGVDAITSAFLTLMPAAVPISLGFVALLAVMNLRGVRESGTVFAIPTFGFVAVVFAMIGWGGWRLLAGDRPVAESASIGIHPVHSAAGAAAELLALRAFSQGCTALTGVEAVSNGVPNFKEAPRAVTRPAPCRSWASRRSRCSPASPPSPWCPRCGWPMTRPNWPAHPRLRPVPARAPEPSLVIDPERDAAVWAEEGPVFVPDIGGRASGPGSGASPRSKKSACTGSCSHRGSTSPSGRSALTSGIGLC
jgi:hypothetical protein